MTQSGAALACYVILLAAIAAHGIDGTSAVTTNITNVPVDPKAPSPNGTAPENESLLKNMDSPKDPAFKNTTALYDTNENHSDASQDSDVPKNTGTPKDTDVPKPTGLKDTSAAKEDRVENFTFKDKMETMDNFIDLILAPFTMPDDNNYGKIWSANGNNEVTCPKHQIYYKGVCINRSSTENPEEGFAYDR